jgi:hypothetical protein
MAAGVPAYVERTISRVEVTFDRPHAVVAVAPPAGRGRACRCSTARSQLKEPPTELFCSC